MKLALCALLAAASVPCAARADDELEAKFQSTYVWQSKPALHSPYEGAHSLSAVREKAYTFSATAFLTWHAAPDTEWHLDLEAVQGVALSRLQGLGGMANGEAQKTAGPRLVPYRARVFLRHTFLQQGERDRIVVSAGNFAVNDIFDKSAYAGDPRTQFLNWGFITHGAFDFPADARGYTNGAVVEAYRGEWQVRAGRFMLPKEPNGTALDWRLARHYGDVVEVVHTHAIAGREGNVRILAFRDRAVMASYADALALAPGMPSLDAVRGPEKSKTGWGIALDQQIAPGVGLFIRAARADGRTEVYAFAEIDRSLSAGLLLKGGAWDRADDTLGIALARHGLSAPHRNYLAAGGLGFFVGDGGLNYAPETIAEAFYSARVMSHCWLALDVQWIRNPGYNADRGPARVISARVHAEF